MISIDPQQQSAKDNYKLLIGSIVPRPIAFVTTQAASGTINAAPFSYFSIVSSSPPLLSIAVQRKAGVMKDTARNAIERGELVVHVVDEQNVGDVNETAASLPPDQSELALTGLHTVPSTSIGVPGIVEAKIRMECVLEQAIPLGATPGSDPSTPSTDLLIARVVRFHIADELYSNGRIDAERLQPVSRLAGNYYATLGTMFETERPE